MAAVNAKTFDYEAFGGVEPADGTYQSWGYSGELFRFWSEFEDFGPPDARDPNGGMPGVSWGNAWASGGPFNGQSGLGFRPVPLAAGQIDSTSGVSAEFGTVVHFNEPITRTDPSCVDPQTGENQCGNDVTVSWNLILRDPVKPLTDDPVFDANFQFGLYQWETFNDAVPCPRSVTGEHEVHGHIFVADGSNQTSCDDAFTFEALNPAPIQFPYEGTLYGLQILGFYETEVAETGNQETPYTYTCLSGDENAALGGTFWSPETMRNAACVRFLLTEIGLIPPDGLYVDIKPMSCPNAINNKLNPNSGAVLPVALLGTEEFDVTQIVPESVELCSDVGCVAPIRWSYGWAAAPYDGPVCEDRDSCTTDNDAIQDLTLKFRYAEVLTELGLRDLHADDTACLTLRATTIDGTQLEGQDVVWINRASDD
jgi:hypothetical protein